MWQQQTRSVCPVCDKTIDGLLYEEAGRILLRKNCPEHGEVRDVASSNADLFKGKMALAPEECSEHCTLSLCGAGVSACPHHVGKSSPITFLDITTRCNLACPVCYINATAKGKDLSLEDIKRILHEMKTTSPETHLVLIGGEPTIHPQFFEILAAVRDAGLIKRCYLATNGLMMSDEDFCRRVRETGLHWFYLAFDSTEREICRKIRGSDRSYEAPRKTIENLRKFPGSRVVLSVCIVKGVNDQNLPRVVDFAMENSDVVKKLSISAELYCGRQTSTENLLRNRVTAECIEGILREGLQIEAATLSFSLYAVMLKPLKLAGVLPAKVWTYSIPHPLCGSVGMVGKNGSYYSLLDLAIRNPGKDVYRFVKKFDDLGKEMERKQGQLSQSLLGRIAWKLQAWFYYLPAYFFTLLGTIRPSFIGRVLSAAVRSVVTGRKLRNVLFGKQRVELYYLFGCDKYSFMWDRMPHCQVHHFRIDPRNGAVVKMSGCFVLPFRSYAESCNTIG
ncbi:MAG: radical SAM protein [Verrucomicrobia bacterium]|nr:radical SAM protein [Verrucomicrobiota bacterium]